jgi:hypothetical protein
MVKSSIQEDSVPRIVDAVKRRIYNILRPKIYEIHHVLG